MPESTATNAASYTTQRDTIWGVRSKHASAFDEAALEKIDQRWRSSVDRPPASVPPSDACWGRGRARKADIVRHEPRVSRDVSSNLAEGT
jgi:hypothetical protein